MSSIETVSSNRVFGGWHHRYRHSSSVLSCDMTFAVYLPPQAQSGPCPVLYWLSGLTCTDENFMQKAGAQRIAAELGFIIVAPDTSPRGDDVPDDAEGAYDFGLGAGFYLNATQTPWNTHYHMYDYIVDELPNIIDDNFPTSGKNCISGHSMGGHGALTIALKNPGKYVSASAFSPIANPTQCPWGEKAFSQYLGNNRDDWKAYDTCELLKTAAPLPLLIDQGSSDNFLEEQLGTPALIEVVEETDFPAQVRMQEGYDHSYYFISSFIAEHLHFHHQHIK